MKITPTSKPEEKKTKDGKPYWSFKAIDENGKDKSGNYFGDIAPEIDKLIEVEEKEPTGNYTNYTWFKKSEKKAGAFIPKPSMSVESQTRAVALQEANKTYSVLPDKAGHKVIDIAKKYETYLKTGE